VGEDTSSFWQKGKPSRGGPGQLAVDGRYTSVTFSLGEAQEVVDVAGVSGSGRTGSRTRGRGDAEGAVETSDSRIAIGGEPASDAVGVRVVVKDHAVQALLGGELVGHRREQVRRAVVARGDLDSDGVVVVDLQTFLIHDSDRNKEVGFVVASGCREIVVLDRTRAHDDIPPVSIRILQGVDHSKGHPLIDRTIFINVVGA